VIYAMDGLFNLDHLERSTLGPSLDPDPAFIPRSSLSTNETHRYRSFSGGSTLQIEKAKLEAVECASAAFG
jgi:hypothetical protein